MIRAFKYFSIAAGGTPQPLIGTTISAAVGPVAGVSPPNPNNTLALTVADNSMFSVGDWGVIGKPSSGEERLLIQSKSGTTTVTVRLPKDGLVNAYGSGSYFRLSNQMNSVYIQGLDGNTGPLYVGTGDAMVKATGVLLIAKLQQVATNSQPIDFHDGRSGLANADDCGALWIDGTTGDKYLPSIGVV